MIFSGDDIEKMLEGTMRTKSACRTCGTGFSFQEGVGYANKNGITDKVVMCPKCNSVYEVNVTPRGVTLLDDVTHRYSQIARKETTGDTTPKKWWQFWK